MSFQFAPPRVVAAASATDDSQLSNAITKQLDRLGPQGPEKTNAEIVACVLKIVPLFSGTISETIVGYARDIDSEKVIYRVRNFVIEEFLETFRQFMNEFMTLQMTLKCWQSTDESVDAQKRALTEDEKRAYQFLRPYVVPACEHLMNNGPQGEDETSRYLSSDLYDAFSQLWLGVQAECTRQATSHLLSQINRLSKSISESLALAQYVIKFNS